MHLGAFTFRRKFMVSMLLVGLLLLCAVIYSSPVKAAVGINNQINFQGRLLNSQGATVPDGYYNIEFKIYQDGDGQSVGNTTGAPAGSLKWTEDYLNANSQGVVVKNGFLSVQLGSVNPFGASVNWNQDTIWLSMNVAGTGAACTPLSACSPDGEMIPMKRLSASPYAINSGLLGGLASAQFLQLAQGVQTDNSTATNSIFINKTSTGNLLDLQSSGTDAFVVTNTGDVTFGSNTNHTLSVATAGAGVAGKALAVVAGAAGTGASALAGGNLSLQAGSGGGTNGAGGNIVIDAGLHNGTGADGTINIGTANAATVTLGKTTNTTTINGSTVLGAAAGTGTLTNNGSTINSTLAITGLSSNGPIGTAAATVDAYTSFSVTTTVNNLVLTVPNPTLNTTYGRIIYVSNVNATNIFTLNGIQIRPGATGSLIWTNTSGGASWTYSGVDGSSILNQSTQQTSANFNIDGTGTAGTSILTPLLDTASGALNVGTGTATGVTIGGTTNTASVLIQGSAAATYTIGTISNTGGITLGNSSAINAISIGNAATTTTQTINIGTGSTGAGKDTLTIGSGNGTSSTTIQGGVNGAATTLALQVASGGVVGIASNGVAQTVNIGNATGASAVNIASGTGNITIGNTSGTVNQTINIGTNVTPASSTTVTIGSTIAGATSLQSSGGVTVSKSLTAGSAAGTGTFTNNGSTVNTVLAISNSTGVFGTGTAAGTVDVYTAFSINAGTTALTYNPPTPTANTTYGRMIYISNVGTNIFTVGSYTLSPGGTATLIWANTNGGASWQFAGTDGSSILNQTATTQPASFNISGTGTADNFKVTAGTGVFDTATGGLLNIGTATATGIIMGGSTSTANTIQAFNGTTVQSTNDSTAAFSVQNSVGASMLTVDTTNTAATSTANVAVNGGSEAVYGTEWAAFTGGTVTRDTTAGEFISGKASLKDAVTAANTGAQNNLGVALTTNSKYIVSFSAKASVASAGNDLAVNYYRTSGTLDSSCTSTLQSAQLTTGWFKYNCIFTTTATAGTALAFLAITQTSATNRSIFIDDLSVVQQNATGTQNTGLVRLGGVTGQSLTLLQLDTFGGTPFTGGNQALAGAMYFDTTAGKMQCYDGALWGACGAAPNSNVTLTPEYAGAVLNGTGIGTLTSNFCGNDGGTFTINTSLCAVGDARNFYNWTSVQASTQSYSLYVTFQLPSTFKNFVNNTTALTARIDSLTNASVSYKILKSTGSTISSCSANSTIVGGATGAINTWTKGFANAATGLTGSTDPSTCGFAAGNYIIFQINTTAANSANSYIENLNFSYSNQ